MILLEDLEKYWDYYTEKKFLEIKSELEPNIHQNLNENLKEIYYLSLLELEKQMDKIHQTKGMFKDLLSAMYDYHNKNYILSSKKLFQWILEKKLAPEWIIFRLYHCAKLSNQYDLIIKLSLYLLKKKVKPEYVHFLFNAYNELKDYEKALQIFETYREAFLDTDLTNVGLILIKLKKYKEAERILLHAYKKITGKEYTLHYEEYERNYRKKYDDLKEKYRNHQIEDQKELFEFGIACLFSNDFSTALSIFSKIKKETEKAA